MSLAQPQFQRKLAKCVSNQRRAVTQPVTGITGGEVRMLAIAEVDQKDLTFRFRHSMQRRALRQSIEAHGQHSPIVVRPRGDERYQVVAGFRRLAAITDLGWSAVVAVVREDLNDEDDALLAAILDNTARQPLRPSSSDQDSRVAVRSLPSWPPI